MRMVLWHHGPHTFSKHLLTFPMHMCLRGTQREAVLHPSWRWQGVAEFRMSFTIRQLDSSLTLRWWISVCLILFPYILRPVIPSFRPSFRPFLIPSHAHTMLPHPPRRLIVIRNTLLSLHLHRSISLLISILSRFIMHPHRTQPPRWVSVYLRELTILEHSWSQR